MKYLISNLIANIHLPIQLFKPFNPILG